MADYDRRPNYDRRPRGGRGRFNDRKRRYGDDDYDGRNQRRRYEEPLSVSLRKQIMSVAESPHRKAEDDVADIALKLANNYFDSDITAIFLDLSIALTVEQPLKIPFIAAIVLLVNVKKPEFAEDVLKKIGPALQKYLDEGCWREVKLCLRFLGCLQGLFGGEGVFGVLEDLFQRAVELQTESSEDSLGLELVKIILLTIPYVMASSANGFEPQASALLEKTDIIASTPHTLETLVNPYPSEQSPSPATTESALALLQRHMQEEANGGWELVCLPRPWKASGSSEEEDPLLAAQKHPFPELIVPEKVQLGPRSIYPEIYFSVYTEQDIETVPASSDPAALLIRDAVTDAINVLDYNRHIAARFLIDLDCYFASNTFVKRATAFDKLRDLTGDRTTWKPEDVVVDAAFAQLFQLPAPEHKLVYYHSVLTEACKIAPAAVAPSLGRAIRYLYRNIERMDLELSGRFLDWFAHHLSNFGFTWKWTEWTDDVELPNLHTKKAFIQAALDKEIRLSFAQRIKGTLPEPYQPLISDAKEKEVPDFKFTDDTTPFSVQGKELAQLIRRKASDEEFQVVLQAIEEAAAQSGIATPQQSSTDALVTAICWVGSKSLSHVLACIERCHDRLVAIANTSPAAVRQIITSVMDYWRDQPGVGVNIVDKLLNYKILTPASVIEWALVDKIERGTALATYWIYEMISGTTSKVASRVHAIVRASRQADLPAEQVEVLRQSLEEEMGAMKSLFEIIDDALVPICDGNQDQMMESSDGQREEEEAMVKTWAGKYLRVFRRKVAVEESWVREELLKPVPAPPPEEEPMQEVEVTDAVKVEAAVEVHGNGDVDADAAEVEEPGGKRAKLQVDGEADKIE